MANHRVTQSYYDIVNGKMFWHWEPARLEQIRSEIAVAEFGIRYYTEEYDRPEIANERREELAKLIAEFDEVTNAWRAEEERMFNFVMERARRYNEAVAALDAITDSDLADDAKVQQIQEVVKGYDREGNV